MSFQNYFLLSFLFTVLVEVPILLIGIKLVLKNQTSYGKIIFWGLVVNFFSFPYLWFVFPLFFNVYIHIYLAEIFVIIIEAILLYKALNLKAKNTIILSVVANTASYLLGMIILK